MVALPLCSCSLKLSMITVESRVNELTTEMESFEYK